MSASRCTLLDGCLNVYLDVGTSIGAQIRKLWEPDYFPIAGVRKHFDRAFNRPPMRNRSVDSPRRHCHASKPTCWQNWTCAVGMEANPVHTKWLRSLEGHYRQQGRRTFIFTETAATAFDGNITFFEPLDVFARLNHQWGASTVMRPRLKNHKAHQVRAVNLSRFIDECIAQRRLPLVDGRRVPGNVTMKMDIEGQELAVLSSLYDQRLGHGPICAITESSMIELHTRKSQGYFNTSETSKLLRMYNLLKYELPKRNCSRLDRSDDERYAHDPRVFDLKRSRACFAYISGSSQSDEAAVASCYMDILPARYVYR